MINKNYLHRLSLASDVRCAVYTGLTGDLYILGDNISLKSLIFARSLPRSYDLQKHVHKGTSASIRAARNFLDAYFGVTAPHKPGPARRAVKVAVKKSMIRFEYGDVVLHMDMSEFTKKEIAVYRELLRVPFGGTISYGKLAARAGVPGGARFAGNAMAKNTIPIIIPCHRVINADGTMGNYSGGTDIKKLLLNHERNFSLPLDRAGRF